MSYIGHLRLIILVAIGVFCWDNISYVPSLPEPVVVQVDTTRERLAERQLWLVQESQAYGLRRASGVPWQQARRIVENPACHDQLIDLLGAFVDVVDLRVTHPLFHQKLLRVACGSE